MDGITRFELNIVSDRDVVCHCSKAHGIPYMYKKYTMAYALCAMFVNKITRRIFCVRTVLFKGGVNISQLK